MIVYYNCAVVHLHQPNHHQNGQLINTFLNAVIAAGIRRIGTITDNTSKLLHDILHHHLLQLPTPLYPLGPYFTANSQQHQLYQSLSQLAFVQPPKGPVQLQNLTALKQYFLTYSQESEMKAFLKDLLVERIDSERRVIVYRKEAEVRQKVKEIMGEIEREGIEVVEGVAEATVVGLNEEIGGDVQQIVSFVERNCRIDRSVNAKLTVATTLQRLAQQRQKKAKIKTSSIFHAYYETRSSQILHFMRQMAAPMMLTADLKAILKYGLQVAEEEIILQQQFEQFVLEMNAKYTAQTNKYIAGFRQQLQYAKSKHHYQLQATKISIIKRYFKAIDCQIQYRAAKLSKLNLQCKKVQDQIRNYLIQRRSIHEFNSFYALHESMEQLKQHEQYQQIRELFNSAQIAKISKFNRHKYGFSSCIHILHINSSSLYPEFRPQSLLKMIEKSSKYSEPFTRWICEQEFVQLHTLQGRSLRLGQSITQANKQNMGIRSNYDSIRSVSSKTSAVSLASSQWKGSKVTSNGQSRVSIGSRTSISSSTKGEVNDDTIYARQERYELKVEAGKLWGRGCNYYGQLGLVNQPYAVDWTIVLPLQRFKSVSTACGHTLALSLNNKLYHFGKATHRFPQTFTPIQLHLTDRMVIKQLLCTQSDSYILSDLNKVYSLERQQWLRLPKQMQLQFDSLELIRSGGCHLQIVYVVAHWSNSLDPRKRQQISKYLTNSQLKPAESGESLLIEASPDFNQLSAIQQQSFC